MANFDLGKICDLLDRAEDMANNTAVRGRLYEDVIEYLISQIPGCQVQRNSLNRFQSEEVDLSVSNYRLTDGLRMLPEIFLIECKNWSKPADSSTVSFFATKIRHRGCSLGIMVSAKGITGDPHERTAAQQQASNALQEKTKILLITTDDLRSLSTVDDLVSLIHRRFLDLHAAGTITLV